MRTVAKLQFVATSNFSGGAQRVSEVIQRWGDGKFARDASGSTTIRRNGVAAQFDRQEHTAGTATEIVFDILEPVPDGELQTQAKILETAESLNFQCALALGSNSGVLTPQVEIRSPRFIRDIINLGNEWQVAPGAERIFAKCFDVELKDVETLKTLMVAPQRRLPIIAVSELQGETLAGDLHERVSADTCGLAHTCRLTGDASWELTTGSSCPAVRHT
jgi:hypothetical protein